MAGSVEYVDQRVQVRTDLELDPRERSSPSRRRTGGEFAGNLHEASSPADTTDDALWHEACARDAEAIGDSFGAGWHLDRLIAARPGDGLLHARRARARLWAGDIGSAGADIERAIALGPRDRILDWLAHRAEDFRADRRPADAIRMLDPVIVARPDEWLAYALRAEDFAALGRKADREADVERAIARARISRS